MTGTSFHLVGLIHLLVALGALAFGSAVIPESSVQWRPEPEAASDDGGFGLLGRGRG